MIIAGIKKLKTDIRQFKKSLIFLGELLLFTYLSYKWKTMPHAYSFNITGMDCSLMVIVYFAAAYKFTDSLMNDIHDRMNLARKHIRIAATLGITERLIYALCFVVQEYIFIAIWLGIKIARRLLQFKDTDVTDNGRIKLIRAYRKTFIIGNLVSLILGIVGGYLIQFLFNLPLSHYQFR